MNQVEAVRSGNGWTTGIYYVSETYPDKYAAMAAWLLSRLMTLEPQLSDVVVPHASFLPDTTPTSSQWRRKKSYYSESLSGTDSPDRWLIEKAEIQ